MWIYWWKLYESKFQASCIVKRMENDYWLLGMSCPDEVEIFRSKRGRYGIRYILGSEKL